MIIISINWLPSPQGFTELANNPFCEYSQTQIYRYQLMRCITISKDKTRWDINSISTAQAAFERFAQVAMKPSLVVPEVTTSLYDFLTFVQSHGWHPIYFDISADVLPILESFSTMCVEPTLCTAASIKPILENPKVLVAGG